MPYHWTVTVGARVIGRIASNRDDDGPELALWLARDTLGTVDPLDVRVAPCPPWSAPHPASFSRPRRLH